VANNVTRGKDWQKQEIANEALLDLPVDGSIEMTPEQRKAGIAHVLWSLYGEKETFPDIDALAQAQRLLREGEAILRRIERNKRPIEEVPPLVACPADHPKRNGGGITMSIMLAVGELERMANVSEVEPQRARILAALKKCGAKTFPDWTACADHLQALDEELALEDGADPAVFAGLVRDVARRAAARKESVPTVKADALPGDGEKKEAPPTDEASFSLTSRPAVSEARRRAAVRELAQAMGL
jgi:hypothetical protein